MNDKNIIVGIVVLLIAVGGILFIMSDKSSASPSKVANAPAGAVELAQCLKDNGAVFYGAFWCPHCKKQKELFGSAEKLLPYVECSTPDGNNQNAICKEKGVTGYPTWVFKDGSQLSGEQSLAVLAEKSLCTPSSADTSAQGSTTPQVSIVASTSIPEKM